MRKKLASGGKADRAVPLGIDVELRSFTSRQMSTILDWLGRGVFRVSFSSVKLFLFELMATMFARTNAVWTPLAEMSHIAPQLPHHIEMI